MVFLISLVITIVFLPLELRAQLAEFKPDTFFIAPPPKPVTTVGTNRQPLFIDNDQFVFVSSGRKNHKSPQLYIKKVSDAFEKRITHQSGQISSGHFIINDQTLIYSSSTDEDKEYPLALKETIDRFPSSVKSDYFIHADFSPQEIYQSSIDGIDIIRLTDNMGFDGFPVYNPSTRLLYFSSFNKGQISLYSKPLSETQGAVRLLKTNGHDWGLQLSQKNKKFTWSRFSPDFKSSQILIAGLDFRNPQFVTLESGIQWSPVWHPNGETIIYSAKAKNRSDFDLFEIKVDGECQRQITSYEGDEFFPTVSPDGEKILFTATLGGQEQIYKLPYPGPWSCQ